MTNKEALQKLKDISNKLQTVDYSEIVFTIKSSIKKVPIPLAKLRQKTPVDRARINGGEKLFTKVDQLNYITDKSIIDNYMKEYGRANKPHQPMFYGAVESTLLGKQRATALYEISKLLQDRNSVNIPGELYTVSRWKNKEELMLAEIVFAKEAIKTNPDTKRAFNKQVELAKQLNLPDIDFYMDMLIFFSEEFAREKRTHHDYKISNAYTELILTHPDVQGISYPSVPTKFMGQNVVFSPQVIDNFFTIETLVTQRVHKNAGYVFVNNHKNCENPQNDPNNLVWVDVDPKHIASWEKIKQSLKIN